MPIGAFTVPIGIFHVYLWKECYARNEGREA